MRKAPGDLSEHHCYVTVGVIPFPLLRVSFGDDTIRRWKGSR
uniref:Uncharacterized protein n=1 Tax=Anguilla anguilla TaxID=7936 RepID=A0A0E9VCS6_ANGAN